MQLGRDKKPIEFPGTSEEKSKVQKIDFTDSRILLVSSEIKQNFPNLYAIYFKKCNLPFTLGKLFLDSPFEKVKSLSISETKHSIQMIRGDTLERMPELQNLAITKNRIDKIDPNFLRNGKKLISVGMQDNSVNFPPNLFSGLKNVKYLFLQGNGMVELNANTFKDSNNLETIDLSNNNFNSIAPTTFDGLTKLNFVILHWAKCVDAAYGPNDVQDKMKNDPNFKKCHKN